MLQGYFAVVVAMLIWGSVGIFARKAGLDPLVAVTFRLLFGAAAMALVTLASRTTAAALPHQRPGWWSRLLPVTLSGLALALNWLFFFKAISMTSVTNGVLSYYTSPVIVALASPILLGERLEGRTLFATALAFGGLIVMVYQPGQHLSASDMLGIGYGLAAACFYAIATIAAKRLADVPATRLVLIQCVTAALIVLPYVILTQGVAALAVSGYVLGLMAVVGVVHTALALVLYFHGLRRVKMQHVGVLAYLDPVSAVLFAYLFLGELPTAASIGGGGLVLLGSALLLRRPKEKALPAEEMS